MCLLFYQWPLTVTDKSLVISAPSIKASGICGTVYVAEPLDACSSLTNKIGPAVTNTTSPFVLIVRGGCSFDEKVRRAQAAGFKTAIVYDSENDALVASMFSSTSASYFQFFMVLCFVSVILMPHPLRNII